MKISPRHINLGFKQLLQACLVMLTLCSCSKEEWLASRALSQAGISEINAKLFQECLDSQDYETVELILASGKLGELSQKQARNTLEILVEQSQTRALLSLIKQQRYGFAPNIQKHALRTAITNNSLGVVNSLFKGGFTKEVLMSEGQSPINYCLKNDRGAMLRLLLKHGVNADWGGEEKPPLEYALTENAAAWKVGEIARSGINLNFMTEDETPILHEILVHSDASAVQALLENDVDVTLHDRKGRTALYKAVSTGEIDKVKSLVDYQANVKHKDTQNRSYLHLSQIFCDSPEVTNYLLDQGLSLSELNSENQNALDLALEYKREKAAQLLIDKKGIVTNETFNRLYQAGNGKGIEILIKAGQVDPDTLLSNGDTILIDAIKLRKTLLAQTLLEQGANPNLKGVDQEPPLSYATAIQDYDTMKTLIEKGAETHYSFRSPAAERFADLIKSEGAIKWFIKRDLGITPIMMACDQGNLRMCRLLMDNGAKNTGSKKFRFWPGNFAARRGVTDVVQYMVGAEPGNRDRTVLVDLSSQRATVYNADKKVVMSFRISSGKKGYRTKTGEFVVTNKKRMHISTIYDSEMPYFQRLSYGDFGFHTGVVPGYPASHGCIRCPNSYAYKLFNYLKVGDVVKIQK